MSTDTPPQDSSTPSDPTPDFVVVITPGPNGTINTAITNMRLPRLTRAQIALAMIQAAAEVASAPDERIPTQDQVLRAEKLRQLRETHPAEFTLTREDTGEILNLGRATFMRVAGYAALRGWTVLDRTLYDDAVDAEAEADAGLSQLSAAATALLKPFAP